METMTSDTALTRLMEGNERFATNVKSVESMLSQTKRGELMQRQLPFAVVLGCSDARVPAEIVFDQGLGDLFVIRVAGNIVAPSQIDSVEFAVDRFGTPLVVVLGHTGCGAIEATIEALTSKAEAPPLKAIVDRVRPSVAPLVAAGLATDPDRLRAAAVRANILASVEHVKRGSQLLERRVRAGELRVVGAEYDLSSGRVTVVG
jgi:carbonic anhydrase